MRAVVIKPHPIVFDKVERLINVNGMNFEGCPPPDQKVTAYWGFSCQAPASPKGAWRLYAGFGALWHQSYGSLLRS